MNTGADEMRGSSDCYHQIMQAQTRLRGNQVLGTGVERTEIRIKRNGGRGRCQLHGNVGTCIIDSRIKRVTFYIPALQKAFAKRVQKSMYTLVYMFVILNT